MIKGALLLLIVAVIAVFSYQNTLSVTVSLLFWRVETSLAVIAFLAVLAGVVVAQLAHKVIKKEAAALKR
jgi:uncharacterized integral membrane protein